MTSCPKIVTSLSYFQFMANLKQSGSPIMDAEPGKFKFSLIVIFYLTTTENRTKTFLTKLSHYCFD